MNLTKRQASTLNEIYKFTVGSSALSCGYSKFWTPKTNEKLAELGLVEFVDQSVVITQSGRKVIDEQLLKSKG